MRMEAWGQTKEQIAHWMQRLLSQTGMSTAMLRFSYCEVAVGNVPSIGIAETGRSSPKPAMILPVTSWTNCGALFDTEGGIVIVLVALAGTTTWWMFLSASSTAALFIATTLSPALP